MSKANSNPLYKSGFALQQNASKVRAVVNKNPPKDKQKPLLQLFAVNLPEDLADELENLIEIMTYTKSMRDGGDTSTLKIKAMQAIIAGAQQYWAEDLSRAMKRMKPEANIDASPTAQCQDRNDFPNQEDGTGVAITGDREMADRPSAGALRPRQLRLLT
jgi:hypothetical protein